MNDQIHQVIDPRQRKAVSSGYAHTCAFLLVWKLEGTRGKEAFPNIDPPESPRCKQSKNNFIGDFVLLLSQQTQRLTSLIPPAAFGCPDLDTHITIFPVEPIAIHLDPYTRTAIRHNGRAEAECPGVASSTTARDRLYQRADGSEASQLHCHHVTWA